MLRFEVLDDPVVRPVELAPGLVTWPVPVATSPCTGRSSAHGAGGRAAGRRARGSCCACAATVTVDDGVAPVTLTGAGGVRAGDGAASSR